MKMRLIPIILFLMCVFILGAVHEAYANANFVQKHYKWRDDDGDETDATWLADEDNALSELDKNENIRVRFSMLEDTGTHDATPAFYIQYATSTDGPWTSIPAEATAGEAFEMASSAEFTDLESTTNQLTPPGADFDPGCMVEYPSNKTSGFTVDMGHFTEAEYCIVATDDASDGETYYLKLYEQSITGTPDIYAQVTVANPVITGTIYDSIGGSAAGARVTVTAKIYDASTETTSSYTDNTNSEGEYVIDPGANLDEDDVVVIYLDDDPSGNEGTAVTKASSDGSAVSNLDLYYDTVAIYEAGGGIDNSDLSQIDSATDDDIKYTVSGGSLSVTSGFVLYVNTGSTFTPGGDVTVDSANCRIAGTTALDGAHTLAIDTSGTLDIDGVLNLDHDSSAIDAVGAIDCDGTLDASGVSAAINAGGNIDFTNGTFTAGSSTVTLDGAADQDITSNGQSFFNLVLNNGGTSPNDDITLQDALDVDNDLTLSSGDLNGNNKDITIGGDWDNSGSGSYTAGTETVTFDDASKTTTIKGDTTFHSFSCTTAGKGINFTGTTIQTISSSGSLTLDGQAADTKIELNSTDANDWNIKLTSGALQSVQYVDVDRSNASSGATIYAVNSTDRGTNTNWAFDASATCTWDGSAGTDWATAANWDTGFVPRAYDEVIIPDTSAIDAPVLDEARTVASLTINANGVLTLNGKNLTVSGNITVDGTLTASGSETISVGGNWDFGNGVFNPATSDVTFNGSGDSTLDAGTSAFNTLTVNMVDVDDTLEVINNPLTVGSDTLLIQNGKFEVTTDSTFNGNVEVQDGGAFVCRTSLVTLTFAAGIDFTVQSGGSFSLNGQVPDKEIKLRSATAGSQWNLILEDGSSQDIRYVDVKDSNASGGNTALATLSIDSGNNVNWSFSGGIVYDSQTGDRIKDALVTLYKADSMIYTSSPQPNPQTSDNQGKFFFEVGPGRYYLESRHKDYKDYRGGVFTVTGTFVNENIAMEPLEVKTGQYLSIAKTVSKKTATIGDILNYTITVKNIDSNLSASGVTVTDSLPQDFKYADGTSRIDNVFTSDPSNKRTPSWSIGTLTPKQSRTLSYRVIVGPDAKIGKNRNSAEVTATVGGSSTSAGPSVAVVDIKEGLFTKRGMIIGKVFHDIDQDGVQDMDEKGLPHLSLILEDGTIAITDEFGRFSIPDVAQGMHALRLDQRMLPGGPLSRGGTMKPQDVKEDPRGGNENLIQKRRLGEWIKDVIAGPGKAKQFYANGAASLSLPPSDKGPHYRSDIPDVSKFVQVPESGTAKCNFPVSILTTLEEELQKRRHEKETQFMIIGIADGTVGYLKSDGKVENIAKGDNIAMSLEVDDKLHASGKVILYAKGKIKGEYLLTTRYDSTRDYDGHLYSWINPEKYYPVYADESVLANDADSQGRFFIRIDKGASYAMAGNYETDEFAKTELSKYNRTLHGVSVALKSEDFTKKKKDGIKGEASFFRAETLQERRQDIFQGRGLSGPYYLTKIPVLEETENVKMEVRDKSRYDVILEAEAKSRDKDYEIDYGTGRLMFREPVPTYDENNDPIYIIVDYEYVPLSEEDKHYITGSRGEITLFDKLNIGSQVITEDREGYFYDLIGIDSIWQITPNTKIAGEVAHSRKTDEDKKGEALRLEGSSTLFDDRLNLQAYGTYIDKNYSNPVNVTERDVQKYGAAAELGIAKNLSLITDHWSSRAISDKIYDRQTEADLVYKDDRLFLSAGYGFDETIDEKGEIDDISTHEINAKGGAKLGNRMVASTEYSWQRERYEKKFKKQIDKLSPRLDVKLNDDTSIYARHDYTREKTRGTDSRLTTNTSTAGLMIAEEGRRSYVEYGFTGARIESAAFGTEEDIPISDEVTLTSRTGSVITKDKNEEVVGYNSKMQVFENFYVGGNFERTQTTGDTDYEETAVGATADYIKNSENALGTKLEFREAETKRECNAGLDLKFNMNDETYLLAKAEYQREEDFKDDRILRETRRIVSGLGYRPLDNDKLDLFTKYEYREDLDNVSASVSDYISHTASIEGIYEIAPKWELFAKYALKGALEDAGDTETRSFTDLKTAKLTYRFNPYVDAAGIYRILQNYNTETMKQGAAGEVGLTLFNYLRVATGYNFLDYSDTEYPGEDYQGIGPYLQVTYKFLDDAEKLFESREEMLRRFADEAALELYKISRIPGDEKFVEEMRTYYAQAMKWYKFEKYREAIECLQAGMEAYYAARRYASNAETNKEEFLYYLKQGEKLYTHGLKDEAFALLEKAYKINAFDKKVLNFMAKVRDEIKKEKAERKKIVSLKLEELKRIKELKDDTKLVFEIVKLHFRIGKRFYYIGDYENAISEWKSGIAIAERASKDYFQMEEERKILVNELESIYKTTLSYWEREEYINSKKELQKGLELIGKALE